MVALFLTSDFEEIEAVSAIDVLRRGGVGVEAISLTGELVVKGAHSISIHADKLFDKADFNYEMIVLPGGKGTANYLKNPDFTRFVPKFYGQGGYVAAICAAPTVLGNLGLLNGKKAVCYPGMEEQLKCAEDGVKDVEIDGRIITSKGPGTSISFSLAILKILAGKACADEVARGLLADYSNSRK